MGFRVMRKLLEDMLEVVLSRCQKCCIRTRKLVYLVLRLILMCHVTIVHRQRCRSYPPGVVLDPSICLIICVDFVCTFLRLWFRVLNALVAAIVPRVIGPTS